MLESCVSCLNDKQEDMKNTINLLVERLTKLEGQVVFNGN